MRSTLISTFVISIILINWTAQSAQAQLPGMKKKPPSTEITHIGGRSIREWIKLIPSKDRSIGENAIQTVLLFGPDRAYEAVPTIIGVLRTHRSTYPLDVSIRVNGCIALGVILGGANDPDIRYVRDSVSVLMRFLRDRESIVKYRAAEALGRIGPEAKSAIPELLYTLQDKRTWETRMAAATALGLIANDEKSTTGPPTAVLNALYRRLADKASSVRLAAIQSLTWLGAPANPVHKAQLIRALSPVAARDPHPTVQIWGRMALMSITKKIDEMNITPIAQMLTHKNIPARIQAAQALGTIGPKARSAVPALIGALKDKEQQVVGWSIWALSRMELWGAPAVTALQTIAKDPERPDAIKRAATQAMKVIQGKTKDTN